jgi:hypothetical protein
VPEAEPEPRVGAERQKTPGGEPISIYAAVQTTSIFNATPASDPHRATSEMKVCSVRMHSRQYHA